MITPLWSDRIVSLLSEDFIVYDYLHERADCFVARIQVEGPDIYTSSSHFRANPVCYRRASPAELLPRRLAVESFNLVWKDILLVLPCIISGRVVVAHEDSLSVAIHSIPGAADLGRRLPHELCKMSSVLSETWVVVVVVLYFIHPCIEAVGCCLRPTISRSGHDGVEILAIWTTLRKVNKVAANSWIGEDTYTVLQDALVYPCLGIRGQSAVPFEIRGVMIVAMGVVNVQDGRAEFIAVVTRRSGRTF